MEPTLTGTKFNVEPAGVSQFVIHIRATNEKKKKKKIAILSYNHGSLQEPALNALNLNAL